MGKPNRLKHPTLAAAWDAYGHSVKWDDLVDAKFGSHGYAALAWMDGELVDYADLASPDHSRTWEMQNDGHEPMTMKAWRAARVKPACDWLVDANGEMI